MKVSQILRKIRKDNNLTLKELSQKSGISISFISDIENGRRKPSIDTLESIATALNISVNEFFQEQNNKQQSKANSKKKTEIETIAAHLEGKELTPKKVELLKSYIDALFDSEE